MVTSAVLAMVIVASGYSLTAWIGVPLRGEERLVIGAIVGVVATSVVSVVTFLLIGMNWGTVLIGVGAPATTGLAGAAGRRHQLMEEWRSVAARLGQPARRRTSLRPLVLFAAAAGAVTTRTLSLAYQRTGAGISAGSLATWSDWAAHLAYAGSFAYGDNRALELPLAAGTPLRYHFLTNFFGSLFTVTGLELTRALVLSAWVIAITVPALLWCFAQRISGSRLVGGLTALLFLLAGGVGWWYFLVDVDAGGWSTLTALPRTYARIGDQHLWVDNTISASLFAQRSTLLGIAIGLSAGIVLLAARPRWATSGFAAAGVLVGITGIVHVHLLGTAVALGAFAALADRRRQWLWFLVPALVVGAPLAWAIRPETSSTRWLAGWMAAETDQPWIWFWIRNVGLLLPLFVGVSVLGGVSRRVRRLTAPLWLWFIVPNLVAFHPSEWNNTKFFLFWQFAGCLATAAAIERGWRAVRARAVLARVTGALVGGAVVVSMTVSGGLDAVRSMQRASAIPWVDADDEAAALWLRDHAVAGQRIVYGATNTSAVAALGGVPAVSGYPGWTWDLGLADWGERVEASRRILSGADDALQLAHRYQVTYVVIGPRERREMAADDSFWDRHGTLLFRAGEYRIYGV